MTDSEHEHEYEIVKTDHEHSNHPDFQCVLVAEWRVEGETTVNENHALIYTDGCIALTLYEYCYAIWSVRTGEILHGRLWKRGDARLNKESLEKIKLFNGAVLRIGSQVHAVRLEKDF